MRKNPQSNGEEGADLFVLTSLDDIAWLLNIRGEISTVVRWFFLIL